ncbi:ABC transporter substrate-binding protein, partial [Pectobacterium atrosepticum]
MKTLKRLTMLILLVSVALGIIACGGAGAAGGAAANGPVAKAEAIMAEETAAGVPDFTSPSVEDKSLKVSGMPEEVVWMTSNPKDLSSKGTKKGGTLHLSLGEYPTTFRYLGPESNLSTTYLMNP